MAVDKAGTLIGGGLVAAMLALAPVGAEGRLFAIAAGVAVGSLVLSSRLHVGYVGALEKSLLAGRVRLDPSEVHDRTTELTLAQTGVIERGALLNEPEAAASTLVERYDAGTIEAEVARAIQRDRLRLLLEGVRCKGRRALVVEDDANSREVLTHHLEREGWRVRKGTRGTLAEASRAQLRGNAMTGNPKQRSNVCNAFHARPELTRKLPPSSLGNGPVLWCTYAQIQIFWFFRAGDQNN